MKMATTKPYILPQSAIRSIGAPLFSTKNETKEQMFETIGQINYWPDKINKTLHFTAIRYPQNC